MKIHDCRRSPLCECLPTLVLCVWLCSRCRFSRRMCRRLSVRRRVRKLPSSFSKTCNVRNAAASRRCWRRPRETYKIPLVQHDFPLPLHNWSFEAAVLARYFDTHSKEIGNDFRDTVFAHQMEIIPQNLRGICREVCRRSQDWFAIRGGSGRQAGGAGDARTESWARVCTSSTRRPSTWSAASTPASPTSR